jgi:hypothetical protein
VVGGPAAFVVVAQTFDSFADAMLRKLVQEVAGTAPAASLAALTLEPAYTRTPVPRAQIQ